MGAVLLVVGISGAFTPAAAQNEGAIFYSWYGQQSCTAGRAAGA